MFCDASDTTAHPCALELGNTHLIHISVRIYFEFFFFTSDSEFLFFCLSENENNVKIHPAGKVAEACVHT